MSTAHRQSPIERVAKSWPTTLLAFLVAVFIIVIGTVFFVHGKLILEQQMRERLRSITAAAAMQFDPDVIARVAADPVLASEALEDTVQRLQHIREQIPEAKFTYIMQRKDPARPEMLTFVADADMALNDAQLDTNGNGSVDEEEESAKPGEEYDASAFPMMLSEAFERPSVDDTVASDQWGSVISAYAPIQKQGRTVAILGLDMAAEQFVSRSQRIFSPLALILILLGGVTLGSTVLLFVTSRRVESLKIIENERSGFMRLTFHQLGEPLAIINWSLELLKDDIGDKSPKVFANMEEGVSRLKQILYTLRDADMVHAGKMRYSPEVCALGETVQAVVSEALQRTAARAQTLEVKTDNGIRIPMDKKLITSVLRELVNNAIDYSPKGGTITIRTERRHADVLVEVKDDGCGIPAEDLDRLFNPFVRASNASLSKPDGSGLGLYIVRGIIEQANGRIWVYSKLGKGATFSFTLPLA